MLMQNDEIYLKEKSIAENSIGPNSYKGKVN